MRKSSSHSVYKEKTMWNRVWFQTQPLLQKKNSFFYPKIRWTSQVKENNQSFSFIIAKWNKTQFRVICLLRASVHNRHCATVFFSIHIWPNESSSMTHFWVPALQLKTYEKELYHCRYIYFLITKESSVMLFTTARYGGPKQTNISTTNSTPFPVITCKWRYLICLVFSE